MRIPDRLIAFACLAAMLIPAEATAQFKIGPYISKAYPRAESDDVPADKQRMGRVPLNQGEPPSFGPDRIECAASSDLCAWKRQPGEAREFEFTPR